MVKANIEVYEAGKQKDGSPFRRLRIQTINELTGEVFEVFNVGMSKNNLMIYDLLIEKKIIIESPLNV